MKRAECTLQNMKERGWTPLLSNGVETYLTLVRDGAEVRRKWDEYEDHTHKRYTTEKRDEDFTPNYPRYHTVSYERELMQVKVDGKWVTVMELIHVIRKYKTRSQMYMGD